MSANKYLPHLLIIPEDDANRQLANGFVRGMAIERQRQVQVLPIAGGWGSALTQLEIEHLPKLDQLPYRNILLLIDFDGKVDARTALCRQKTPPQLAGRVFVLGARSEPEQIRQALPGSNFESIGAILAAECIAERVEKWSHELLAHNAVERARLRATLPTLFSRP